MTVTLTTLNRTSRSPTSNSRKSIRAAPLPVAGPRRPQALFQLNLSGGSSDSGGGRVRIPGGACQPATGSQWLGAISSSACPGQCPGQAARDSLSTALRVGTAEAQREPEQQVEVSRGAAAGSNAGQRRRRPRQGPAGTRSRQQVAVPPLAMQPSQQVRSVSRHWRQQPTGLVTVLQRLAGAPAGYSAHVMARVRL